MLTPDYLDQFQTKRTIGAGSYGTVYLATDLRGREVVIKKMTKNALTEVQITHVKEEVNVMSILAHEFIVKYVVSDANR